jgi:hypothetical protein
LRLLLSPNLPSLFSPFFPYTPLFLPLSISLSLSLLPYLLSPSLSPPLSLFLPLSFLSSLPPPYLSGDESDRSLNTIPEVPIGRWNLDQVF